MTMIMQAGTASLADSTTCKMLCDDLEEMTSYLKNIESPMRIPPREPRQTVLQSHFFFLLGGRDCGIAFTFNKAAKFQSQLPASHAR